MLASWAILSSLAGQALTADAPPDGRDVSAPREAFQLGGFQQVKASIRMEKYEGKEVLMLLRHKARVHDPGRGVGRPKVASQKKRQGREAEEYWSGEVGEIFFQENETACAKKVIALGAL